MLGLMDQPTSSHICKLAMRWSGRRSGGSLEQVFDQCRFIRCDWKTFDEFLRFCIHAWFSNDFLQPRCFPHDLYAVNIAGNAASLECLPHPTALFLSRLRMRHDQEKLFPGCCKVVPFLRNYLWIRDDAITTGDSRVKSSLSLCFTCVFRNLFKFLPQHVLHGRMINVVMSSHH